MSRLKEALKSGFTMQIVEGDTDNSSVGRDPLHADESSLCKKILAMGYNVWKNSSKFHSSQFAFLSGILSSFGLPDRSQIAN